MVAESCQIEVSVAGYVRVKIWLKCARWTWQLKVQGEIGGLSNVTAQGDHKIAAATIDEEVLQC